MLNVQIEQPNVKKHKNMLGINATFS